MKLSFVFVLSLTISSANCLNLVCPEETKEIGIYNNVVEVTSCIIADPLEIVSRDQEISTVDGSSDPSDCNGLIINHHIVQYFPKGIGKFFPELILLHITHSQLKEINQNDLGDLPNLRSLDLEGNELKYLAGDLLVHNKALQEVSFRSNQLNEIGEDIFSGLDELHSINLEDNVCISMTSINGDNNIEFRIKSDCNSMKDWKRKHCSQDIKKLEKENSDLMKEIEILRSELSDAKVKLESCEGNLDSASRNLLELTRRRQARQKSEAIKLVQKINLACEVDGDTFEAVDLKIEEQEVEIQNIVSGTNISCSTLIVRNQQTLYLPTNLGYKFESLKNLEVTFSGLIEIDKGTFSNMKYLESLNLTGNKLREIPIGSFESLEGLKSLDLSFNNIEVLESKVFTNLVHLKFLSLQQNLLAELGDGIFDSLKGLQTLNLSSNKLKFICGFLCNHLTELKTADFSNNECINKHYLQVDLEKIEADIIDRCIAPVEIKCTEDPKDKLNCVVTELDVSYPKTKISVVYRTSTQIFQENSQKFEALTVHNQSMHFIPFELSQKFPNLTEMSIESSKLSALHKHDFEGMHELTNIIVAYNNITFIENGTFDDLQKLENLILASNNIHALPEKIFFSLAALKTLNISGNLLKRLSANVLKPKNSITHFIASNNHLEFVETKILRYLRSAMVIDFSGNACVNMTYEFTSMRDSRALSELSGDIDLYCSEDSSEAASA